MCVAKKILAIVITLMMILSAIPMAAFAAEAEPKSAPTVPVYEGDAFYGDERLAKYERYTTTWTATDYAEKSATYSTAGWNNEDYVGTAAKLTVYYDEASAAQGKMDLIVYVINYEGERVAVGENADDDITIITDYIEAPAGVESGNRTAVMVVDFGNTSDATVDKIERSLTTLRIWLKKALTINSKVGSNIFSNWIYNLPAGYRVARDIPFFDSSVHASLGTLNYVLERWNIDIAGIKNVKYQFWTEGETIPERFVVGSPKRENNDPNGKVLLLANGATQKAPKVSRVEDCLKPDGSDLNYICRLDILYPTGTHTEATKAPVYLMGGTESARTRMVGEESTTYADAFLTFTFRGYATVIYDFAYTPMARDDHYGYIKGFSAGYQNGAKVARAAMRCVRYYADLYDYSRIYTSGAGISKGSTTASLFAIKDNTNVPEASYFAMSENDKYLEGGAWADVYQPYSTYEGGYDGTGSDAYEGQTGAGAVDSNAKVAYTAGAEGTAWVGGAAGNGAWKIGDDGREMVPTFVTFGETDTIGVAGNTWKAIFNRLADHATESFVTLYMEQIGHSYPTGHDAIRGVNRKELMIDFFDYYLRPNNTIAPQVIGITPTIANDKWEGNDTIQSTGAIKVQFLTDMDTSTLSNMTVTNLATGKLLAGEWVAINDGVKNQFKYVYDGELEYGSTYEIKVPTTVKGSNGVAMEAEKTSCFKIALPAAMTDQIYDFENLTPSSNALTADQFSSMEWLKLANPNVATAAVDPLDPSNTVIKSRSPLFFHDTDGRMTQNTVELSYRMLWSTADNGSTGISPGNSGFFSLRYNGNAEAGETYILRRNDRVLQYYSNNSTPISTGIKLQMDTWYTFRFLLNPKTGQINITIAWDGNESTFSVVNNQFKESVSAGNTNTYFYPLYQWSSSHSLVCYDDIKIITPKVNDSASVESAVKTENQGFTVTFDDYNSATDASTSAYIDRVVADAGFAVLRDKSGGTNADKQVVVFDGDNGYIKATGTQANEWSLVDTTGTIIGSDKFTFSFKMKANPDGVAGGGWGITYANKLTGLHYCLFKLNGTSLEYKNSAGQIKGITTPADWTEFKFVIDNATETFDLYVGGQCIGTDMLPYGTETGYNLSFVRFPWVGGKISYYMFDDISVTSSQTKAVILDMDFEDAKDGETVPGYIDRKGDESGLDTRYQIGRWDLAEESDGNTYIRSDFVGSKGDNAPWDILDTNKQWMSKYPFEISYDVKWNPEATSQSVSTTLLFGNLNKGYTLLQVGRGTETISWAKPGLNYQTTDMPSYKLSTTEWTNIRIAITPSATAVDYISFDLWINGVYQGNIYSCVTDTYKVEETFLRFAPAWNSSSGVTPLLMDNVKLSIEIPADLELTGEDAKSGESLAEYLNRKGSTLGFVSQSNYDASGVYSLVTDEDGNSYFKPTTPGLSHFDIVDAEKNYLATTPFEVNFDVKWNVADNSRQAQATCFMYGTLSKGYTLLQCNNDRTAGKMGWLGWKNANGGYDTYTLSATEWTNVKIQITPPTTAADTITFKLWINGEYKGENISYYTDTYASNQAHSYDKSFLRIGPSWNSSFASTDISPFIWDNLIVSKADKPSAEINDFASGLINLEVGGWKAESNAATGGDALRKPANATEGLTIVDTAHKLIGTSFAVSYDFRLDSKNTKSVDMFNAFSVSALTLNNKQQLVDSDGNVISEALSVGKWYNLRVIVESATGKTVVYLDGKALASYENEVYTGSPIGIELAVPTAGETATYAINNINVCHSNDYKVSYDVLDLNFSENVDTKNFGDAVEWGVDTKVENGVLTVNTGKAGVVYHAGYYDNLFKMFVAEMQVKLNGISGTAVLAKIGNVTLTADASGKLMLNGEACGKLSENGLAKLAITVDSETKLFTVWVDGVRVGGVTASDVDTLTLLDTTSVTAGTLTVDDLKIDLVKNTKPVMVGWQSTGGTTKKVRFLATVDTLYYTSLGFDISATGKGMMSQNTDEVFTSIVADGETFLAEDLGGRYIVALTVEDIPRLGDDISFTLTPYAMVGSNKTEGVAEAYKLVRGTSYTEDYENHVAATIYSGNGSYDSYLSDRGWDYIRGGQYGGLDASIITEANGNKAMMISGLGRDGGGNYSARVKLPNYILDNLNGLVGETLLFTAKVKVENMVEGEAARGSLHMMIDKNGVYNAFGNYTEFSVSPADGWVTISNQITVTKEMLTQHPFSDTDSRHWPYRVAINLGRGGQLASTFYIDDVCVSVLDGSIPQLSSIYAEGMVLQKSKEGTPTLISGYGGTPGDTVTVALGNQTKAVTVDKEGNFSAGFETEYTESTTLKVTSSAGVVIRELKNVAIGEVWYCSGQSNMELKMSMVHNVEDLIADADNYDVRTYKIPVTARYEAQNDVNGKWSQVTSANAASVSAIAYVTAYQLQKELGVPVALIECYNGGSAGQAWLSRESVLASDRAEAYNNQAHVDSVVNSKTWGWEGRTLLGDYDFYWQRGTANEGVLREGLDSTSKGNRFAPTGLYNGMVAPLRGYSVAGVMWYQGEANNDYLQPDQYSYVLSDLINQWRSDFRDADLPVMVVQLAPYSNHFEHIRQTQFEIATGDDNVGLIVTAYEGPVYDADGKCIDLDNGGVYGKGNGVHPGVKVPVGNRMYNTIMNMVYGANYEYSGPLYESMTVSGNKAILTFTHADGLQIRSGDTALKGFTVSADGKTFVAATATIVGNTVEVYADGVASPVAVRYAYVNKVYETRVPSPEVYAPKGDGTYGQAIAQDTLGGNLENSASLPAAPFEATLAD